MLLLLLAYLGGALTLLSPCILPVLPFVFARADRPFLRSTLPLLLGMALTFTVVASLAAVGSQWVAQANQVGRWIALLLMALFALALLWPRLADHLLAPFQRVGARLSARADATDAAGRGGAWTSLLIGIATGLLWAPCAGPILGLVLTGAALHGASAGTSTLLLAYALGAITALALAVWVGGRVFRALQARLGLGDVLRKVLGVAALLAVVAIGLGWDTGLLTRLSTVSTARIEQGHRQRIAQGQLRRGAGGGRQVVGAGLAGHGGVQHPVGMAGQRGFGPAGEGHQRHAHALDQGQQDGELVALAAVADGQHHVLRGDHAQIAMAGFGRVHELRRGAGGGQRGGQLAADVTALAHAHDHHAPPAGQQALQGAGESRVDAGGQGLHRLGLDDQGVAGQGEGAPGVESHGGSHARIMAAG